jgi:hypothetical protein
MIIELPVTTDPAQRFTTQLGDTKIVFDLQWNDRSERFELSLFYDATQEVIVRGLNVVLGCDLLEPFNFNLGHLVVVDTANLHTEANLSNFGTVVKFMWVSADEVLPEPAQTIPAPALAE